MDSPCAGVIAFGDTLKRCEAELRSTLEDWILVGLKLGHPLPVQRNRLSYFTIQSTQESKP